MLIINRIKKTNDMLYQNLYSLYESSFPIMQRRSQKGFEEQLKNGKNFFVNSITENDIFIGLLNYWVFDKFIYIEHFAIEPEYRGKKYGSEVIKLFITQNELPIVFEVEVPHNKDTVSRINFFERLNFYVLSNFYMQPPYENSMVLLTMLIMSNDYHFANKHFQLIKETLYKEVYHYENN